MVFFERRLCRSRLLEWKNAVDVHFEWTGLDQLIQSVYSIATTFAVVCFGGYSCGRLRFRHYAVWISNPAISPDRSQRSISRFTARSNKRSVNPVGSKLAGRSQHFVYHV